MGRTYEHLESAAKAQERQSGNAMNDVTTTQSAVRAASAAEVQARVDHIKNIMRAVMKSGAHYGVIPGTKKPTLYKAGSEILLCTFHIAVEPEVQDLSTADKIHYRVIARGIHMRSGETIGTGVGECSSNEERYRWRKAICDEEFDETPPERRRIKFERSYDRRTKKYNGIARIKQVRTEPADLANTILKMAKKRAQIDLCLTALAASDIFSQDLEDLPETMRNVADDAEPAGERSDDPEESAGPDVASEAQITLIRKRLESAGMDEAELCKAIGVDQLEGMPFEKVNEAMSLLKKKKGK